MKNICFLLFLIGLAYSNTADNTGVVSITFDNFDQVLQSHDLLLVNFCVPPTASVHCARLEEDYAKIAKKLAKANSNVKLGTTIDLALLAKYNVQSHPNIKLFRRGETQPVSEYHAGRTSNEIMAWLAKKTVSLVTEYKTFRETDNAITRNNVVALFLGPTTSQSYSEFVAAAIGFDTIVFITSNIDEVRNGYGDGITEDAVIVFANYGEEKNVLTKDLTSENIKKFISDHRFLTVMPYGHLTSQKIFSENLDTLFLVIAKDAEGRHAEEIFRSVVPEVKDLIKLSLVKTDEGMGTRFVGIHHIKAADLPAVVILQPSKNRRKYVLDKPISAENILNFVHDFLKDRLTPTLKSEAIPAEPYDNNVRVLVSKNHDSVVLDEEKDVLVLYYAHWDGESIAQARTYYNLARKYKDVSNLVIAKIDASLNEFLDFRFEKYPAIIFYPKNDKKNPIRLEGKQTEDVLTSLMKKHVKGSVPDTEL